ncbi:hypothetical protein SAMN02927921_03280 [Sinomicrobium oceani]|uniref:Uncharacterized protein n=1 Tax=Sinomicrobium oceani TaxID=1150368 RepID=A0A1K1R8I8_9FLAO|nr:hypothetical protein [Sinomicrobium oceani]SFW68249.1 hypothetical protein SAMN02927921_03280 [Sinomicrobium oceani]
MKRLKRSHRVIALFLVFSMLPALVPYNMLQASGNGPTAPEATGFEPVDATDMVNLMTGDLSYVLPLLNVPSPEGGYPLALAYHAGIAMDQEASWVGLGWSLNPGAINRSVNGYPDDYNASLLTEYFYDQGGRKDMYSLSLGFTSKAGVSVGLGLSWGSNRSLGGYVSVGYGLDIGPNANARIGTNGIGVGGGYTVNGGLSADFNAHTSNGLGGSVGLNNGEGFEVGLSSSGTLSIYQTSGNQSIGMSMSSKGMGVFMGSKNTHSTNVIQGVGVGLRMSFNNTMSMGDYTVESSGWAIPVTIPTPIGIFSLSFGKQRMKYYLNKKVYNYVNGPLFFNEMIKNEEIYKVEILVGSIDMGFAIYPVGFASTYEEGVQMAIDAGAYEDAYRVTKIRTDEAFMDIYEVPIKGKEISRKGELEFNNPVFPAYDNYNVQAQGISGSMSSRLFENGVLYGLSNKENDQGYQLKHALDGFSSRFPDHARFDGKPYFYIDNEISTYLEVKNASFNSGTMHSDILDYYSTGVKNLPENRRVNSNFIEYFTNREIRENPVDVLKKGFLHPLASGFSRMNYPSDGIGAFKITAPDGKTYHYSLPVYNHEIVTRTFGVVKNNAAEAKSYFEKRQLEPYATHWLLTAVTGPDFVDTNGNGMADQGDYGYWVAFEYGKWSEAFGWKTPYGTSYLEDDSDPGVKTYIRGRKEVYYLNKVITRTHKALFIKEERKDAGSSRWAYNSVAHKEEQQSQSNYVNRFTLPRQNSLRLSKIILVKNPHDVYTQPANSRPSSSVEVLYNDSSKPAQNAEYNLWKNVLDIDDDWQAVMDKAVKVIDFAYDYSLAENAPDASPISGRSALRGVQFRGKKGALVIPPYRFAYYDGYGDFNIEDKDEFGYYGADNKWCSLKTVITPQGGQMHIVYEGHNIKPAFVSSVRFTRGASANYKISKINAVTYRIESGENVGIQPGDQLSFKYSKVCEWEDQGNCGGPCGYETEHCDFEAMATVTSRDGNNKFTLSIPANECSYIDQNFNCDLTTETFSAEFKLTDALENLGGIRVREIITSDGTGRTYNTTYRYGKNENGVGYISYLPYAPELQQELPYSAELPAPKVMYDQVSVEFPDGRKNRYYYSVMKEKDPEEIKYEDFYEISKTASDINNTAKGVDVNVSTFTIKDNLSALGRLEAVEVLNKYGQQLSKIENEYYDPGTTPGVAGVTQESYQSYKIVDYKQNTGSRKDKWLINSSSRIRYPNVLKSSAEYRNGHVFRTVYKDMDPVTGVFREAETTSASGEQLVSRAVPAYIRYPEMGSMVHSNTNKNMLTQIAETYSYIREQGGAKKYMGAGITTWKPEQYDYTIYTGPPHAPVSTGASADVWRKHKSYTWDGALDNDGTLATEPGNFIWSSPSATQPAGWKLLSEITLYDNFSNVLEVKDINGNKAATKRGDGSSKVFATGNTAFNTMFYSGLEEGTGTTIAEGVTRDATAVITSSRAHTGSRSVQVASGVKAFKVKPGQGGTYRVSVWAHTSGYTGARVVSGGQNYTYHQDELVRAGDWVQLNFDIAVNAGTEVALTSASGTVYFDDFRIHPVSAGMSSYVYNEDDELTYILGPNNMGARYVYDAGGRLKETYTEIADTENLTGGYKLTSEVAYNYARIEDSPYVPLKVELWEEGTYPSHKAVMRASGGSGQYEYRWSMQCGSYASKYGNWTSSQSLILLNNCSDRVYVRCEVRDLRSDEIKNDARTYKVENQL